MIPAEITGPMAALVAGAITSLHCIGHGVGKRTNELSVRWRNVRVQER